MAASAPWVQASSIRRAHHGAGRLRVLPPRDHRRPAGVGVRRSDQSDRSCPALATRRQRAVLTRDNARGRLPPPHRHGPASGTILLAASAPSLSERKGDATSHGASRKAPSGFVADRSVSPSRVYGLLGEPGREHVEACPDDRRATMVSAGRRHRVLHGQDRQSPCGSRHHVVPACSAQLRNQLLPLLALQFCLVSPEPAGLLELGCRRAVRAQGIAEGRAQSREARDEACSPTQARRRLQ